MGSVVGDTAMRPTAPDRGTFNFRDPIITMQQQEQQSADKTIDDNIALRENALAFRSMNECCYQRCFDIPDIIISGLPGLPSQTCHRCLYI